MENPREYTIKSFKVGDFKDNYGNTWCEILFEEWASEPIRVVVKDPATYSVGKKVYGHIEVKESKAGKPYNRFYTDKKPDGYQGSSKPSTPSSTGQSTDESIARSVALKAAVEYCVVKNGDVLSVAETYLSWLQGVKPKLDLSPDPMDRVFQGAEQFDYDPNDNPFTD